MTFAKAIAFATQDGSTLVVSTSDHEAGGLAVGRNEEGLLQYAWYPEVIDRIPGSNQWLPALNASL